ncbi:MAG: sulfotransferase domain-containing protein [Spirochaetes bacterium]|nr:sulfotransferase domain-containing protein [Spirochaetota bacterium]
MKSLFTKKTDQKNEDIIIVSGLPRSGTSMMMQMLEAGGLDIMTDGKRTADDNNLKGYYEFEKTRKIKNDISWIQDCGGKAVKIVSPLLYFLPEQNRYRIIFMERDMREIINSQNKMLERLNNAGSGLSDKEMILKNRNHIKDIKEWISARNNMDVIYINYNEVINSSLQKSKEINEFLENKLDTEKMSAVIDRTLYRQRAGAGTL